jgi:putative tricarboxylic transport membrane protein
LAIWFVAPAGAPNSAGTGLAGPLIWPRTMLFGIACCAALLLVRNLLFLHAASEPGGSPAMAAPADDFDNRHAALGIGILILYVGAIPLIGFAMATAGFFLIWLPFGGVRRKRVVLSVALLGTVALLYTFVKLTTLPLDRGIGVFDGFSVALYRLLGIY